MKTITFLTFSFETQLKEHEVMQRLYDNIQPSNLSLFNAKPITHKAYTGEIRDRSFEIYRVISYRNSFLPIVKGDVQSDFLGTVIKVRLGYAPFLVAFMALWFTVFFMVFGVRTYMTQGWNGFVPYIAIPLGVITIAGFVAYEINRVKKDFLRIFEARQIKNG